MSLKVVNPINIIPSLFSLWLFITSCILVSKATTLIYAKTIIITWVFSVIILCACVYSVFVQDKNKLLMIVSFITVITILKLCLVLFLLAVLKNNDDSNKEIIPLLGTLFSNLLISIFYFKFTISQMIDSLNFNKK